MEKPTQSLRELAAQLLAASALGSDPQVPEAVLVNENFRAALARLTGTAAVASLLGRALALASAEMPALRSVKVNANGQLEGIEHLSQGATSREAAGTEVTAQVLELLVTFIGEGITRRLVSEAISSNGTDNRVYEAHR